MEQDQRAIEKINNVEQRMNDKIVYIQEGVQRIEKSVELIRAKLDKDYLTKEEFALSMTIRDKQMSLLQKIVYSTIGLVLSTVLVALLSLVIGKL